MRARMFESLTALLGHMAASFDRFRTAVTPAGPLPILAILLILILIAGAGYASRLMLRRSGTAADRQECRSANQQAAVTLYTHMIDCCAQQGIVKPPSATPCEFLHHIRERWSEAWPSADALTHIYARARFGHAPLTAEDLATAEGLLRTIRNLDRSQHHPPNR